MQVVKEVGPMSLCQKDGHFFLVRCKEERSQNFSSQKEAWSALRNRQIRWRDLG